MQDKWIAAEAADSQVTFIVDGQDIKASRGPLEQHSDVLKAMFVKDYDKFGGKFNIEDANPQVLLKLILACYCPKVQLSNCIEALDLFKLAHRFNVKHVMSYCENFIVVNKSQVTEADVIEFFRVGDLSGSLKIKSMAIEVLTSLQSSVDDISNLEVLSSGQMREVFKVVWTKRVVYGASDACDEELDKMLGL